jgi:hypothetical protein
VSSLDFSVGPPDAAEFADARAHFGGEFLTSSASRLWGGVHWGSWSAHCCCHVGTVKSRFASCYKAKTHRPHVIFDALTIQFVVGDTSSVIEN